MARIDIIEDDPNVCRLITEGLKKRGHEVRGYNNAQDFWANFLFQPPDLVITDLLMPGYDGFKLCEMLHTRPATQDIPIIVITGIQWEAGQASDDALLYSCGVRKILHKPFPMKALVQVVNAVLEVDEPARAKTKTGERVVISDSAGPLEPIKPISMKEALAGPSLAGRSYPRYPAKFTVHFSSHQALAKEFTENISAGGMFIRTGEPPRLFSEVVVQIVLDGEEEPITLSGTVVHVVEATSGPAGFGVQLAKPAGTTLQRWQGILEKIGAALPRSGDTREVLVLGFEPEIVADLQRVVGLLCRADIMLRVVQSWAEAIERAASERERVRLLLVDVRRDATLLDAARVRQLTQAARVKIALVGASEEQARGLPKDADVALCESPSSDRLVENIGTWLTVPVRTTLRVPVTGPAVVSWGAESVMCELSDISIGGVRLVAREAVQLAKKVQVKFSLPGSNQAQRTSGEVRWTKQDGASPLTFGVAFENLTPQSLSSIEAFVESQGLLYRSLETLRKRTTQK